MAFGGGIQMNFGGSQVAAASPEKKRPDEKTTCLPVTVRSIEGALAAAPSNGGELRFHGSESEAGMLILVAAVEVVHSRASTCIEFTVNDATGRLRARHFITESNEEAQLASVVPGRYVSLYGQVRTTPVTHFAANGVRLVTSADEISYHMIQAAHAAVKMLSKSDSKELGTPLPKAQRIEYTPTKPMEAPVSSPVSAMNMAATATPLKGGDLKRALLEILPKAADERGFSAAEVLKQISQAVEGGEASVQATLQMLVDDGEAFHTLDENHFGIVA